MKHANIPAHWEAHEALEIVTFLERIIDAVWRAHGDAMGRVLFERGAQEKLLHSHEPLLAPHPDDDLPL